MEGLLYVVYNEWIINPKTGKMPYKIGITKKTVDERYYGLGLKMPGIFKTLFAYLFDDCTEAESLIQGLFKRYRVNGEWFEINDEQIELVKKNCENMGGKPATEETQKEILEDIKKDYSTNNRRSGKPKDTSKYLFNGQSYGKGPLVLEVIKSYIKKYPNVTLGDLLEIFPKGLQGSVGVIETRENAKTIYKDDRHFIKERDVIILKSGERIVVSTEWSKYNISYFIEKARKLGFDIIKQ